MAVWFRDLLTAVPRWWRRRRRRTDFGGVVRLESGADDSAALRRGMLVLAGSPERPKWLRFDCPCRCGEVLALNLMASHSPRWAAESHEDGTLSVRPSVDATRCGSHFWIRRSRIDWV